MTRQRLFKQGLFVVAFLCGLWHHIFVLARFGGFGWDEMWQLTAARSLVAGHGLSIPDAYFPDLDRVWYRPVTGWPPGYALIASVLLHFTSNLWKIALGVDIAATVLFFLAFLVILRRLGELVPLEVQTGLVLWLGLVASPLKGLNVTDRLALALYTAAIALATTIVEEGRRHRMWLAIASGLLMGLSGWIRFAYWPLAPLIALALCLTGYLRGGARAVWRYAVAQATVAALVIGGVAMYQRYLTGGHATYISSYYVRVSGLHWENLARFNPFASGLTGLSDLLAACCRSDRLALQWAVSLVVLGVAGLGLGRALRNPRRTREVTYLIVVSLLSALTCVVMLTYLSVKYPKNAVGWTYVQEARYFGPTLLAIYLGLLLLYGELPRRLSRWLRVGRGIGWAAGIAVVAFLLAGRREEPYGFLYQDRLAEHLRWAYVVAEHEVQRAAADGRTVVYVDRDDSHQGVAAMAGARVLAVEDATEVWLANLPELLSRTAKDVRMLVALPAGDPGYRSPLARQGVVSACRPVAPLLDQTPVFECRGRARRAPDRWQVVTLGDFNGDGKLDLLWRHTGSGEMVVWYLRGLARAGDGVIPPSLAPGLEWDVVGAGDVDADGRSELFCRSGATELRTWRLDGPRTRGGIWLEPRRSPGTRWHAVAVGDFAGHGQAGVVVQDSQTGDVAVRLMRGLHSEKAAFTNPPGPPDALWQLVAVGDFDGDGNPDLLWREWSSGQTTIWLMSGFSRRAETRVEPPGPVDRWRPVAAGDIDRDGKAEIVWNDVQTGRVRIVPTGGGDALHWSFPQ